MGAAGRGLAVSDEAVAHTEEHFGDEQFPPTVKVQRVCEPPWPFVAEIDSGTWRSATGLRRQASREH